MMMGIVCTAYPPKSRKRVPGKNAPCWKESMYSRAFSVLALPFIVSTSTVSELTLPPKNSSILSASKRLSSLPRKIPLCPFNCLPKSLTFPTICEFISRSDILLADMLIANFHTIYSSGRLFINQKV